LATTPIAPPISWRPSASPLPTPRCARRALLPEPVLPALPHLTLAQKCMPKL
jgi:hypothetical protein